MLKSIISKLIANISKALLAKYKPQIVGITGSVGKTSAKQAVVAILATKFRVRGNEKNYNNAVGVPLTIIGAPAGGRSVLHWLGVLLKGVSQLLITNRHYPEILVLEMGADHPGDIAYLTGLAPCTVGVVTAIGEAHYEFFEELESIIREKQIVITHLQKDGAAVLGIDNEEVRSIISRTSAKVYTYGFSKDALICAHEETIAYEGEGRDKRPTGMWCKISYEGATVPLHIPGVLGRSHLLAALAGVAVGIRYNLNLVEISEALKSYEPQPGRMTIIEGIKHTTLIDDTYNASPLAMVMALDTLRSIQIDENAERYAVLGDMLELGNLTQTAHFDLGQRIGAFNVDFLVCVGERGKIIGAGARASGFEEHRIALFATSEEAGKFMQEKLKEGDIVLCKASQGIRLEKAVEELMSEPLDAKNLLCRQGKEWK